MRKLTDDEMRKLTNDVKEKLITQIGDYAFSWENYGTNNLSILERLISILINFQTYENIEYETLIKKQMLKEKYEKEE